MKSPRMMLLVTFLSASATLAGCAALMADWQKRTCHYEGGYQEGMNDARANRQMNSGTLERDCPADTTAEAVRGYREGYTAGQGGRIGVVVVPNDGIYQTRCNNNLDCGQGEFCRDRGDGLKLCMGNGGPEAFCAFGTDCGSGLFCRERNDGLKVCR